jgi:hypothetical protein
MLRRFQLRMTQACVLNCRIMNATIITVARLAAIKAVKREKQACGLKVAYIERRVIAAAAHDYLRNHPELLEEAAETVRTVPELRTLAARAERRHKGI